MRGWFEKKSKNFKHLESLGWLICRLRDSLLPTRPNLVKLRKCVGVSKKYICVGNFWNYRVDLCAGWMTGWYRRDRSDRNWNHNRNQKIILTGNFFEFEENAIKKYLKKKLKILKFLKFFGSCKKLNLKDTWNTVIDWKLFYPYRLNDILPSEG